MPGHEAEHQHHAMGVRVKAAVVAPDQMHIHVTSHGVTSAEPNRPRHRHLLHSGGWTTPSAERWLTTATPM